MNSQAMVWLSSNRKFFKVQHQMLLQKKLEEMPDDQIMMLSGVELRDPTLLLIVAVFFGYWGVHRFMIGDIGMGILELLTGGGCGLLWLIDLFVIMDKTKEYNYQQIMPLL